MRHRRSSVLGFVAALSVAAVVARAEVKVTVDHNAGDKATEKFAFDHVPAPAKADAATKATVKIVDGEKDDAARDIDHLTTDETPTESDQPDHNFFFNAGTDGGRFSIDLGKATPVTAVNTYSWHTSTRAPQVYKLWASDGTAAGFNAAPKRGTDPTTCGWKLVATVDTKPKGGDEAGGQYGVSITDPDAKTLGAYRYLLVDTTKTEEDDDFGNTFFSRIDVVTTPKADGAGAGATTMPAK